MRDQIDHDTLARQTAYQRLEWTRLPLRDLEDPELSRILTWFESRMARDGRCGVPVASHVRKERVRGTTGRMAWRWVVYTMAGGRRIRHGEHVRRYQASGAAGLCVLRRWADAVQRRDV